MKKIFSILVFGLVGVALLFPLIASAVPAFPMNFTGTVTINGSNAPIGSIIKAYDSGDLLAQFTLTTAGTYGGARILTESAKLSIPEYSGVSLTFKINSPQYDSNVQLADTETYGSAFSGFTDVTQNLVFTGATPTALISIAITPAVPSIAAGATQQFIATGTYTDASTTIITASAVWSSANTSVATIGSTTGLATGVAYGTSVITATYTDAENGDLTDTETLTVSVSIPGGLTATVVSTSQIDISWSVATGAVSYTIYRDGSSIATGQTLTSYSNTGLSASTAYSYTVSAVNADGETSQSTAVSATTQSSGGGGVGGGGGGGGDTRAPSISNIAVVRSSESATITWQTDESSLSWVIYGTSVAYGSEVKTTTYTTSHSVTLSGLYPVTTYHYKLKSRDTIGNIGTYTDKTFATLTVSGEEAPGVETPETPEEPADIAPSAKPISEMTITELKVEIAKIAVLIAELQQELLAMLAVEGGQQITKSLKLGDRGDEVTLLQTWLALDSVVYPEGIVSGWFGPLTKAAVIRFQEKYHEDVLAPWNFTNGTGYAGSTTRAKLNALYGGQ